MKLATVLYLIANTLCFCAIFPQLIKMIKTRSTKDLSLTMLIMYLIANTLLFMYGLLNKSISMAFSNLGLLILTLLETLLKFRYDGIKK
jgi:MtN3 and saliva related transmembrane protein